MHLDGMLDGNVPFDFEKLKTRIVKKFQEQILFFKINLNCLNTFKLTLQKCKKRIIFKF